MAVRMALGREEDTLAGLELEGAAFLLGLEKSRWDVDSAGSIPLLGGRDAVDEETSTAETANGDLVGAGDRGRDPGGDADGKVVLGQSRRKVAEEMDFARLDAVAGDRLADRLLAAIELDREARLAVEIGQVHSGERRQEEVDPGTRLVDDVHSPRECRAQAVERAHGIRGADVSGAAALGAWRGRVGSDDRDLAQRLDRERQDAVVGQQHERI